MTGQHITFMLIMPLSSNHPGSPVFTQHAWLLFPLCTSVLLQYLQVSGLQQPHPPAQLAVLAACAGLPWVHRPEAPASTTAKIHDVAAS